MKTLIKHKYESFFSGLRSYPTIIYGFARYDVSPCKNEFNSQHCTDHVQTCQQVCVVFETSGSHCMLWFDGIYDKEIIFRFR